MCVAQRERSASAARAQRELSAPAPAHARQHPKASRARRRARSRRRRSRSSRDAGTPTDRARRARAGTPRAASPRRNNPRASPACARSRVRSCMQAHAERGARDGEARRRRPSACGRPPAKHARMARHKGGRSTTTPLPRMRACTCVRSTQPQEARLERPSSPPRSRPASSDQAHRASSVGSHLEGGPFRLFRLFRLFRGEEERRHFTPPSGLYLGIRTISTRGGWSC